ncbi:hypothetical protein Q6346_13155 [Isoptericola sp. b490]|uniref:hypothetical protein n=1 Tax=Actinotalea lenta TaxID=3064654 RepID=UPI00271354F9|nr:hypothetical protein [Isoptericola sp. b490]MDO8122259.1 hypothetical protein [Isoptericola sp. b490]
MHHVEVLMDMLWGDLPVHALNLTMAGATVVLVAVAALLPVPHGRGGIVVRDRAGGHCTSPTATTTTGATSSGQSADRRPV